MGGIADCGWGFSSREADSRGSKGGSSGGIGGATAGASLGGRGGSRLGTGGGWVAEIGASTGAGIVITCS